MKIFRSDQVAIHVAVTGVPLDGESWDMLEGADLDAEELIVFPGAMQDQVALGGVAKRSPITVERLWSEPMIGVKKALDRAVVVAAAVIVSYTVLGPEGASTGYVETYTGVASGCSRPNYKAGTSEEAKLKLKVSPHGAVS
jgi:hypothetical protein